MPEHVAHFIATGGWVMTPLCVMGLLLWFLLGLRLQLLRRGFKAPLESRWNHWMSAPSQDALPRGIVDYVLCFGGRLSNDFVRDTARSETPLSYFEGSFLVILKQAERSLRHYRGGIRLLCQMAPLLGLLGTVSGMIETFSSLTGLQAYSGDATMAGGISKALISTQMGLLVAIPGVVAGRILDRREDVLRDELLQTSEMIERTNQARLETLR